MNYREILSDCFQARRKANPRYSLRAFARDISMSPSRLSEVIAGKGDLSREKGRVIAKNLRLPPLITADFLDLIDAASAPMQVERDAAIARVRKRQTKSNQRLFDEDSFKIIADPKYVLIWNFMMLPAYNGEPELIAKNLKLNILEVFDALRRLQRMNLVIQNKQQWSAVKGQFTAGDKTPSEAVRTYHRQMATMGRKAIDSQNITMRHLDSIVIPFDSKHFGEVQQLIADFAQSLIDDYGFGGDVVYGLSLQFFRMSDPIQ
jgi:uncharacterized protein (TIGR02147 family)